MKPFMLKYIHFCTEHKEQSTFRPLNKSHIQRVLKLISVSDCLNASRHQVLNMMTATICSIHSVNIPVGAKCYRFLFAVKNSF